MIDNIRRTLRHVLASGLSCNAIADQRGMSHHTVRRYKRLAETHAITLEKLDAMSDTELAALFKPTSRRAIDFIVPDWMAETEYVRAGHNRLEAHARYVERVGIDRAFSYRSFCERLEAFGKTLNPVMRIEHHPGYDLQTDYAGYAVPYRCADREGVGHLKLFVACLPFSGLIASTIGYSEKAKDHIEANVEALEYIGGCPKIVVPDNLKAAVILRRKYGPPRLHTDYAAFLEHYGAGALPARARSTEIGQPRPLSSIISRTPLDVSSLDLVTSGIMLDAFGL